MASADVQTVQIKLNKVQAGILMQGVLGANWPGNLLDQGVALRDKLAEAIKELSVEEDGKGPHR